MLQSQHGHFNKDGCLKKDIDIVDEEYDFTFNNQDNKVKNQCLVKSKSPTVPNNYNNKAHSK